MTKVTVCAATGHHGGEHEAPLGPRSSGETGGLLASAGDRVKLAVTKRG